MMRPPTMLMPVMMMPGDGVAADELAGAVHRAVEVGLALDVRRAARRASSSSISPALRSASIAICLPGIASRVNRAATSAMRPAPLVMTTNLMMTRMRKMIDADDVVAADDEVAEGLDDVAGRRGALAAVEQDQPRRWRC